jgi:uncharacterized protein YecE (DUF72 family)
MPLLVGTSGFDYVHWKGAFYPASLKAGQRLGFYAESFPAVELNVTFYRMPAAGSFRGWAEAVPEDFIFAVKASRYITHVRRLREVREPIEFLMERASLLGRHLGPILLQLPPDMAADADRLDRALGAFGSARVAVEFRHPSWFAPEIESVLRRHGAALCLVDRRGPRTPMWRTAAWTYLRFHEGRAAPGPCYGERALKSWVVRLRAGFGDGMAGFAFFNNDARACVVGNARLFGRLAGIGSDGGIR